MKKSGEKKSIFSKKNLVILGCTIVLLAIVVVCVLLSNKEEKMADPVCNDAVKQYLAAADFEGQEGQAVQKGDEIVVDYIGRLDDGTVFDTSVELVAKGCGKYNEARNYDEGLGFTVGAGQMIAGFDVGVEGMKIGQTKTIEIAPADAYGEWDESLVIEISKSDLQNPDQYEEGQTLYTPYGQAVKVHKVTKDKIYMDTNHELAGKTLIFDITVKEIK